MFGLVAIALGALSISQLAIYAIVTFGIIGIAMIVLKQMGIAVPAFIVNILWIIFAVVVGVVAIQFLMSIL